MKIKERNWDILIWQPETKMYSMIAGPFETMEDAKHCQRIWWKEYGDISILNGGNTDISKAILARIKK